MKRFIFNVKRIHNEGRNCSKRMKATVICKTYETALKRLQTAKCQCIEFVRAAEYRLWEQENFEVKKASVK